VREAGGRARAAVGAPAEAGPESSGCGPVGPIVRLPTGGPRPPGVSRAGWEEIMRARAQGEQ